MRVPRFGALLVAAVTVVLGCFITAPLAAQDAVIKGRVTARTGEPLWHALVARRGYS